MKTFVLILAACALAACSKDAPPAAGAPTPAADATPASTPPGPADTAPTEAAYLGRWIGVEGMFLEVRPKADGGVSLEMQWDLDHAGTFDGTVTAEGLRFMRDGVAETAVHASGDAIGLKYLAGKTDCLMVKPGEGYCRD